MNTIYGNLWDYALPGNRLIIPCNIGWRRDGVNVMGRGVARYAATQWPSLAQTVGEAFRKGEEVFPVLVAHPHLLGESDGVELMIFPTKPLDVEHPWLSWRGLATLERIDKSCRQLIEYPIKPTYLPLVGCGNGGLDPSNVIPILEKYLDDNYTLVSEKE